MLFLYPPSPEYVPHSFLFSSPMLLLALFWCRYFAKIFYPDILSDICFGSCVHCCCSKIISMSYLLQDMFWYICVCVFVYIFDILRVICFGTCVYCFSGRENGGRAIIFSPPLPKPAKEREIIKSRKRETFSWRERKICFFQWRLMSLDSFWLDSLVIHIYIHFMSVYLRPDL